MTKWTSSPVAPLIRGLYAAGVHQHHIASMLKVNAGRILEATKVDGACLNVKIHDGKPVMSMAMLDALCDIATADGGFLYDIFVFTPEFCRQLLNPKNDRNRGNRRFKLMKIKDEFAPAMARGEWRLNAETIKFSDQGKLVDGQNRCRSCVEAKTPFVSLAAVGVPHTFFDSIDVGKPRGAADLFVFEGVPNSGVVSGATRWIMILESSTPHGNMTFPPTNMLAYYRDHVDGEAIQHSARIARALYNALNKSTAQAQLCGLHYVLALTDKDKADAFFSQWAKGDSWFRCLNQRLVVLSASYGGRPRPPYTTTGNIIQAWNVFRKGQKLRLTGKNSLTYENGPFEKWG